MRRDAVRRRSGPVVAWRADDPGGRHGRYGDRFRDLQQLHRRRVRRSRRGAHDGRAQSRGREVLRAGAGLDDRGRRARGQGRPRRVRRLVEPIPGERSLALLKLADAIEARGDEIAELEARNAGKPLQSVKDDEIGAMVDNLRFFAGAARNMEGKAAGEYLEGYTSWVRREAVGVIGQIAPWNYPLLMAIWKIGPALAAGNTIVLKPAPSTPLTTLLLGEIASEFLPKGVLNVVAGGNETGQAIVTHRRRRHGLADRFGRDRQVDRARGRRHAQARAPRARRQGSGRRLRRRRHGGRGRDDRRHRLVQRRPGLHRRDARARRLEGLRRGAAGPRRPGRRVQDRRHDGPGDEPRPAQLRHPPRARRGLPGAPAGLRRDRDRR